ncbi:hypothetical protein CJF30_00003029 [Rutstroemia sp. NJR-2017a BBW]|nr:hypothetical protein CJF30_00003029 [Rutstroemia sp. NJR-2017a BBW]
MASRFVSIRAASSKPILRGYISPPSALFIRQSQCLWLSKLFLFHRKAWSTAKGIQGVIWVEVAEGSERNEDNMVSYPRGTFGQLYRVNEREKARQLGENLDGNGHVKSVGSEENGAGSEAQGRPKKRERVRPSGPWYVYYELPTVQSG